MVTPLAVELLDFDPQAAREMGLLPALGQKWPSYLAFALTFLVVGLTWTTHHNLWRYIGRVDQGICLLNFLLILFITATPFAAQVLADSFAELARPERGRAAGLYLAVMLGQAIAFNLILWWARWRQLFREEVDDSLHRAIAHRFLLPLRSMPPRWSWASFSPSAAWPATWVWSYSTSCLEQGICPRVAVGPIRCPDSDRWLK